MILQWIVDAAKYSTFLFLDELYKITPLWVPQLAIQGVAGSFGGFTTTILTNPLDILRARLQVDCVKFNEFGMGCLA